MKVTMVIILSVYASIRVKLGGISKPIDIKPNIEEQIIPDTYKANIFPPL